MVKKKTSEVKERKEEEKEPEGPTEKDLFEMQIDSLRRQLEDSDAQLQQQREALADARSRLESETESQQACVSHLKRLLTFETDRRLDVQEKLQTLRDQSELVERRALGKFAVLEKSREAAKSQFLQQKLELEGKLSLLEELRLKRNSQLVQLKKVEETLAEKTAALWERSREEDMRQVDGLLKRKEEFLERCRQVRAEWREAFQLRMPVHAERQLREIVRLRKVYDGATERLLQVQEQNRNLKIAEKSTELQEEIQNSAEEDADGRKILQEKRLQQLLSAREKLRSPESFSDVPENKGDQPIQKRFPDDAKKLKTDDGQPSLQRGASSPEDAAELKTEVDEPIEEERADLLPEEAAKRKTENIAEMEAEKCRLRDRCDEGTAILKDQTDYRLSLERELEESADENGRLMSAILRAGKIFETRGGKRNEETDFDLLQQIRCLLDLASNDL